MGTKKKFVDNILDQIEIEREGYLSYKKLFGKYVLTFEGMIYARIFDNVLYLLPTEPGRIFLGKPVRAVPFKNAERHFVISKEQYEDSDWFSQLIDITLDALIMPKMPRKRRKLERAMAEAEAEGEIESGAEGEIESGAEGEIESEGAEDNNNI
jgi:TfoX/Sxy family transcriptional regulator of competence genes